MYYVEVDGLTVYSTRCRSVAVEALEDAKAHWPDSKDIHITVVGQICIHEVDADDRE